jgi:hypothetical protein
MSRKRLRFAARAVLLLGCTVACSASPATRTGPTGGNSSGSGGVTVPSNTGGSPQTGNGGSASGISVMPNGGFNNGGACQHADVKFEPKVPTVFLLVDRSGSMFEPQTDAAGMQYNSWDRLKAAALPVIQGLQDQVRFAFGAFTGQAGMCPDFPTVGADLNNYEKIAALYDSLNQPGYKAETPTSVVLPKVGDLLWADSGIGARYVLFVTDGEPDYCDDGNTLCPPDSVVYQLQQLYAGKDAMGVVHTPVKTLVLGVQSPLSNVSDASLQAWADAGSGLGVALWGQAATDPNALYDQCNGAPGWKADFASTGKPAMRGQTIGDYTGTSGGGVVYRPSAADNAALTQQIATFISNVKSCTFDLQGKIEVDLSLASQGNVAIDGAPMPFDAGATNGWYMATETQLVLAGSACDAWRMPKAKNISFDFPCEAIIVR